MNRAERSQTLPGDGVRQSTGLSEWYRCRIVGRDNMAEGEKPTHFHGAPPGILFGRTILVTATRETGRVSRMRLRAAGVAGKSLSGSYLPRSAPNYGNADFTRLLADGIPLRDSGGEFIGGIGGMEALPWFAGLLLGHELRAARRLQVCWLPVLPGS